MRCDKLGIQCRGSDTTGYPIRKILTALANSNANLISNPVIERNTRKIGKTELFYGADEFCIDTATYNLNLNVVAPTTLLGVIGVQRAKGRPAIQCNAMSWVKTPGVVTVQATL